MRTISGASLPTWLMQEPDSVYVKQHVRNKYDPLVYEIQPVQANPNHGRVQYPRGLKNVVLIRDIAPIGIKTVPSDFAQPIEQVQNEQRIRAVILKHLMLLVPVTVTNQTHTQNPKCR